MKVERLSKHLLAKLDFFQVGICYANVVCFIGLSVVSIAWEICKATASQDSQGPRPELARATISNVDVLFAQEPLQELAKSMKTYQDCHVVVVYGTVRKILQPPSLVWQQSFFVCFVTSVCCHHQTLK